MVVRFKGPLFDGTTQRRVREAMAETTRQGATLGQRYVRDIDDDTFKNPTGVARSRVAVLQVTPFNWRVNRGTLIYRWWLEDGGSRSQIFGGYHAFENATPRLERDMMKLAGVLIGRAL